MFSQVDLKRLALSSMFPIVSYQNCILDYKTNIRPEVDPSIPDEMAAAAGFQVDADPALCAAIKVRAAIRGH